MPKYVQKVQIVTGDELELLVAPEGIVPVLSFLKNHHQCQFASLADLGAMDVPSREYRFEVYQDKYAHISVILISFLKICFEADLQPVISSLQLPDPSQKLHRWTDSSWFL